MEKMYKARCRERVPRFHALSRHNTLWESAHVHQHGSFPNPVLFGFWWKYDWLNHWSTVTDSTSSPFPLSEVGGMDWKVQPSNQVAGSLGSQPPSLGAFQKLPHQPNKRHHSGSQHLGHSKHFRSSVPQMGMKTKYMFITNHHITPL